MTGPHCGLPIADLAPRQPRRVKPWLYGTLIGVLVVWAALATLWITGTLLIPQPLIGIIGNGSSPFRAVTAADEMDAWTRLTVQNEFPTLDEASRRKCSDPPFPNSFVALESCAKYQLHLD
ncbi:MAG TPA: hypothetical protein VGL34_01445 [Steroidobacteraceae bacterium]